jgi:hypothetical protein
VALLRRYEQLCPAAQSGCTKATPGPSVLTEALRKAFVAGSATLILGNRKKNWMFWFGF